MHRTADFALPDIAMDGGADHIGEAAAGNEPIGRVAVSGGFGEADAGAPEVGGTTSGGPDVCAGIASVTLPSPACLYPAADRCATGVRRP